MSHSAAPLHQTSAPPSRPANPLRFWLKVVLVVAAVWALIGLVVLAVGSTAVDHQRDRMQQVERSVGGPDVGDSVTVDTTGLSEAEADRKAQEALDRLTDPTLQSESTEFGQIEAP